MKLKNKKMKDEFKKGIEGIRNIKLSKEEKNSVLLNLLENINSRESIKTVMPKESPFHFFGFQFSYRLVYGLATFLIIILGTSTSFAAEGALPGSVFYPVKIKFNEPLVGIFKSDTDKILWEAEKAARRLEEAEVLMALGDIDDTKISELETKFENNSNKFKESLDALGDSNELTMRILEADFDAKILAHSQIFERLENYITDEDKDKVRSIKQKISDKLNTKFAANDVAIASFGQEVATLRSAKSLVAPQAMMLEATLLSDDEADNTEDDKENKDEPNNQDELNKRKEVIQKLIQKTEEKISKQSDKDRQDVNNEILKDSKNFLEEAKRFLKDDTLDAIINSERSAKQAEISRKQAEKLNFRGKK